MEKIKNYLYNLIPSGTVGIIIALFEYTFLNPSTPLYILFARNFLIGAIIGTITAVSFSWTIYKTSSVKIAYLTAFIADGFPVLLITILFGTPKAYGWGTVFIIITITEILAMFITFLSYRYYVNINRELENRKKDFIKNQK